MSRVTKSESDGKIAVLLSNIADGLGRLVSEHIALAKLELSEDAAALAKTLGLAAVFLALVLIGYVFLCAALVAVLTAGSMPPAAALALVGGANLVLGAIGAYLGFRSFASRPVMRETLDQLDRSAAVLSPGASTDGMEVADEKRL
jgi:uncharacterized membrane protein YqjE